MKLRVATFNLENLDEKPSKKNMPPLDARIAVLRPQIVALEADVLCLQECSAHAAHHGVHELRALDRLLEGTPYASFARATTKGSSGGPSDKHNLVVLSRLPIAEVTQHWHDLVEPPVVHLATTPAPRDEPVRWDRPVLEVRLDAPDGRPIHVFDAHLRAPLASAIEGQKLAPQVWRTTEGWAEGYFVAATKRAGQALEIRRRLERIFDADDQARILVAGDLNTDVAGTALRILRAEPEDTGNPALASRSLAALEERVPAEQRYTVVHHGRRQLLDHLLASPALAKAHVATTIDNDGLEDEYEITVRGVEPVGSLHAPIVAELEL
jgi:endonuclease/exonuclease/phosphatase family metal-dependent hydrolase